MTRLQAELDGPGLQRACLWCPTSLEGRRPHARWCSVKCRTYWVREQRRIARRREHPRCAVCSDPMPYGKNGFDLSSVTCSKKCRRIRYRWFHAPAKKRPHPLSPERRREIARRAADVRWGRASRAA